MIELKPELVVWEYTLRCNSKCMHCGSDAKNARENELDSSEAIDVVKKISDAGFKRVILSGGEPTLRTDWLATAEAIKEAGMQVGIISTALHWDKRTIDQVASLDMYSVGFSVDGDQQMHDYLRGVRGSHDKVFSVIKELNRKGSTSCIVTAVNKKNLPSLVNIRNHVIVYELDAWQLQMASPMGRMADNKHLVLDEHEYHRLGEFICESKERLPYVNVQASHCMGYFGKLGERLGQRWDGCQAGIKGLGIESDGTVKGCLSIRNEDAKEGNVRKGSIKEIWEEAGKFKYNRDFDVSMLKGDCVGCEYGLRCRGGCESQSTAFFNEFHHAPFCFYRYEKGGRK